MDVSPEAIMKMSNDEVNEIIRPYFSQEDWDNFTHLEKLQHRLMYVNYVSHPDLADSLPTPFFLVPKNTHSQMELTGIGKKKIKKTHKKPAVQKVKKVDKQAVKATCTSSLKKNKIADRTTYIVRKNPDRASKMVVSNYCEEEVPDDDRYIFCDKCQKEVFDYCSTCGMLVILKDTEVPMGAPDRARKTVPPLLEIRASPIHGLGVFALRTLSLGIQMGPYQGNVSRVSNTNGYSWKLRNGKLVDAFDETKSNWMRYMNCAPHSSAQNVIAFQYKGELFYRTARVIEQGEELLVYYGNSFARELGIEPKTYFDPDCEEPKGNFFTCKHCHVGLSMEKYKVAHEARCRFRKKIRYFIGETFQCLYCKVLYTTAEDRNDHQARCKKRPNRKNFMEKTVEEAKKTFTCEKCNYKATRKGNLITHFLIHDKENAPTFQCNLCSFHTIRKFKLKTHLNIHNNFGLVCILCQKSFSNKQSLDSHYISKHQDKPDIWKDIITSKIHECLKCFYKTSKIANLKRHLTTHQTGLEKFKFKCNICGFKTVRNDGFKTHLQIHTGQRPLVCTECNKSFIRKHHLDGHIVARHSDKEHLMNTLTNKIHSCDTYNCRYKSIYISYVKKHQKSCKSKKNLQETIIN